MKSVESLLSGYLLRCANCEDAGKFRFMGVNITDENCDKYFAENFLKSGGLRSRILSDSQLVALQTLWESEKRVSTDQERLDYQARIATLLMQAKADVKANKVQIKINEETDGSFTGRCPDCNAELIRIKP